MLKELGFILHLLILFYNQQNVAANKIFFQTKQQVENNVNEVRADFIPGSSKPVLNYADYAAQTTLKQPYFHTSTVSPIFNQNENTCGLVKPRISLYVARGKRTDHQQWPWNIQLIINSVLSQIHELKGTRDSIDDDEGEQKVFCGGTIISENFLLTAAHCFDELITQKNFKLLNSDFGKLLELTAKNTLIIFNAIESNNRLNYKQKKRPPIKIYADEIIIHPNYIKNNAILDELSTYTNDLNEFQERLNHYINNRKQIETGPRNDIAIIRFTLNPKHTLIPICLPPPAPTYPQMTAYDDRFINCKVLGQGFMNEFDEENFIISKDLQSADVQIKPNDVCKAKFESQDIREKMNSNTLCIVGPMHPCLGDSGGPLVCQNKYTHAWHLVGVTSFAVSTNKFDRCGQFKSAVFVKVANYLDWIHETTI